MAIVNAGADVNSFSKCKESPLIAAARSNHILCVSELVNNTTPLGSPCHINQNDNVGKTSLSIAAKKGFDELVELFISSGADVNSRDLFGISALMYACKNKHDKCVALLLESGADTDVVDGNGNTSLFHATKSGAITSVELLILKGADVNIFNNQHRTALISAAKNGRDSCVNLIIEAGADVNASDRNQYTALMWGTRQGHGKCLSHLLQPGACGNTVSNNVVNILYLATLSGNVTCFHLLLKARVHVNRFVAAKTQNEDIPEINGNALTHYCLRYHSDPNPSVIKLLLAAEEQVDRRVDISDFLEDEGEISLKSLSRKVIRNYLLQLNQHLNLVVRVYLLGLPSRVASYLLHDLEIGDYDTAAATKASVVMEIEGVVSSPNVVAKGNSNLREILRSVVSLPHMTSSFLSRAVSAVFCSRR